MELRIRKTNFESENVRSSPRILITLNYGQTVCGQFLSNSRDKAAFKFMKAQMFEGRGVLLLLVTLDQVQLHGDPI